LPGQTSPPTSAPNRTVRHLNAVPDAGAPGDDNGPRIERHVLGTAMESPDEFATMRIALTAESFSDPRHALVWRAICAAADAGEPINATAITEKMIRAGVVGRLPHNAYMFDLYQQALPGQGGHWARRLAERATWRDLSASAERLADTVGRPGVTLAQVADLADAVVTAASTTSGSDDDGVHIAQLATDYLDGYLDYGRNKGISTPWSDVNRMLTREGFERGQVVTFGGGPGMGKSIALTDCVRHMGVQLQVPTVMFTLEMTAEQVMCRLVAGLTGIAEARIKNRELTPEEITRFDDARQRLADAPLWIFPGQRPMHEMLTMIKRHKLRYGPIHVLAVDYCQIIPTDTRGKSKENRQLEIAATMLALKRYALNENVLVLNAAQINRGPAQRTDKRPMLSDLRESGEIENSSDIVILLHRDEYYDKESPRAGEADFIVAKQRGGVTDTVTVAAQLHLTRFVSMAEDWDPAGAIR
jgi:replicative DNA helicase